MGYDDCMLRYSNGSIFNTKETVPEYPLSNFNNATDVEEFNRVLRNLLDSLIGQMIQYQADLSEQDCSACLVDAIKGIP